MSDRKKISETVNGFSKGTFTEPNYSSLSGIFLIEYKKYSKFDFKYVWTVHGRHSLYKTMN
jgi:hypothetical protein